MYRYALKSAAPTSFGICEYARITHTITAAFVVFALAACNGTHVPSATPPASANDQGGATWKTLVGETLLTESVDEEGESRIQKLTILTADPFSSPYVLTLRIEGGAEVVESWKEMDEEHFTLISSAPDSGLVGISPFGALTLLTFWRQQVAYLESLSGRTSGERVLKFHMLKLVSGLDDLVQRRGSRCGAIIDTWNGTIHSFPDC